MSKSHDLIDSYLAWLKAKLTVKDLGDTLEITTPFLDRHNDRLQIYVEQRGSDFVLTDHGYVIADLAMSGIDLQSGRRQRLLSSILNGLGVQLEGDALVVRAKASSFPQKKHALLQAMLSVNDLFMTARSTVASLFLEEVHEFFRDNDIRHVASVQLVGKSGFSHRFSFVIPASRTSPERLVEPVNIPDRNRIEPLLFSWSDTRETRESEAVLYALLNDTERRVSPTVLSALEEYKVTPLLWSRRAEHLQALVN